MCGVFRLRKIAGRGVRIGLWPIACPASRMRRAHRRAAYKTNYQDSGWYYFYAISVSIILPVIAFGVMINIGDAYCGSLLQ